MDKGRRERDCGIGSLALAFLVCLRCSFAAVLFASRVLKHSWMEGRHRPVLSGLLPRVGVVFLECL